MEKGFYKFEKYEASILPKGKPNQVLLMNNDEVKYEDDDVALICEIENDLHNIKNKLEYLKQLMSLKKDNKL